MNETMITCRHCGFVAHCRNCLRDHIHKEHITEIEKARASLKES